jgi:hypothetical protein
VSGDDEQAQTLIPVAAQLAATVREYGRDEVAAVLAQVEPGDMPALAVVLAAMVPVDRTVRQLLGWRDGDEVRPAGEPKPWTWGEWDRRLLAHCHARHLAGLGDELTETGERFYQRWHPGAARVRRLQLAADASERAKHQTTEGAA